MVSDPPDAIRIDIESVVVDEDGDCICVELLDVHGVYYTDVLHWQAIQLRLLNILVIKGWISSLI